MIVSLPSGCILPAWLAGVFTLLIGTDDFERHTAALAFTHGITGADCHQTSRSRAERQYGHRQRRHTTAYKVTRPFTVNPENHQRRITLRLIRPAQAPKPTPGPDRLPIQMISLTSQKIAAHRAASVTADLHPRKGSGGHAAAEVTKPTTRSRSMRCS